LLAVHSEFFDKPCQYYGAKRDCDYDRTFWPSAPISQSYYDTPKSDGVYARQGAYTAPTFSISSLIVHPWSLKPLAGRQFPAEPYRSSGSKL
jgi:hypothetical protein